MKSFFFSLFQVIYLISGSSKVEVCFRYGSCLDTAMITSLSPLKSLTFPKWGQNKIT